MPCGFSRKESAVVPLSSTESWESRIDAVLSELKKIYFEGVRPVENKFQYDLFCPSWFSETIVQKKPFVTFMGPFSSGKSSFINYLLQSNYLLTGPQPVTDKFTVIMHGDEVRQIPGYVLMADSSQPFRGLGEFGESFAESFTGLLVPHPILQSVSLVDTPGVLEAAGDMHSRRYDYVKVCRWFVEKSDIVFFLFDPTKLDAGNELRMVFKHALRGHESKIRIVLNKADTIGPQELMRVYGALFWNLSGLLRTTEPPRVYVSSFWDKPYREGTNHALFTEEKADLLYDLTEVVPLQSLDRRVTLMMQRTKHVLIFALLCASFKSSMPKFFGKEKARAQFFAQLPEISENLGNAHRLSAADFPAAEELMSFFSKVSINEFYDMNRLRKKGWIDLLKNLLDDVLPRLLNPIKQAPVADPRDRKHAIMLQRSYVKQMKNQLAGQPGLQGSLGEAVAPAHRASLFPNTNAVDFSSARVSPREQQQGQQQVLPYFHISPDQTEMMMQMMRGMLSMQSQQMSQ